MVAFLPYVMWGDSESASKNLPGCAAPLYVFPPNNKAWGPQATKNTSDPILKIRIIQRYLIFPLACDLVISTGDECNLKLNYDRHMES